eukprot:COSAG03_NODE_21952_length_297_cov_0.777778_1_plen_21_part_10
MGLGLGTFAQQSKTVQKSMLS